MQIIDLWVLVVVMKFCFQSRASVDVTISEAVLFLIDDSIYNILVGRNNNRSRIHYNIKQPSSAFTVWLDVNLHLTKLYKS